MVGGHGDEAVAFTLVFLVVADDVHFLDGAEGREELPQRALVSFKSNVVDKEDKAPFCVSAAGIVGHLEVVVAHTSTHTPTAARVHRVEAVVVKAALVADGTHRSAATATTHTPTEATAACAEAASPKAGVVASTSAIATLWGAIAAAAVTTEASSPLEASARGDHRSRRSCLASVILRELDVDALGGAVRREPIELVNGRLRLLSVVVQYKTHAFGVAKLVGEDSTLDDLAIAGEQFTEGLLVHLLGQVADVQVGSLNVLSMAGKRHFDGFVLQLQAIQTLDGPVCVALVHVVDKAKAIAVARGLVADYLAGLETSDTLEHGPELLIR